MALYSTPASRTGRAPSRDVSSAILTTLTIFASGSGEVLQSIAEALDVPDTLLRERL